MQFLKSFILSLFFVVTGWSIASAEGQRVILVLDASGSMWGQIDGKAKIDIAKDVVGKIVKGWKAEDELGLVAYGHREKGSCKDIEVLREPGLLEGGGFLKSVKALSPKGKTPMTDAVRQAAEALKYTEKKATVILVSDGIETCDADPCAVAADLDKLGVSLTVHTVGFGLDNKGAVSQLKCLADKTGGISILADNAQELESALKKTVAAEPPPPPAPEPKKVEKNFNGKLFMARGVKLPEKFASASWEFAEVANGAAGDTVQTEYGETVATEIPRAGDYVLRVTNDVTKVELPITIKEGEATNTDVVLDAGILDVTATTDGTQKLVESAAFELADADGNWITTKYGQAAQFLVKAGPAKVRLTLGSAKVERNVVVEAGKSVPVALSLGAGVIEVTALYAEGGDMVQEGAAIELSEGQAGPDGQHKWIETQYAAPSTFKAPAGSYKIAVVKDYARGEATVSVKAGETLKASVIANAGFLAVTAAGATSFEIMAAEKDISGGRKRIGTEYGDSLNKAFNAGRYYIEAFGADGKVLAGKEFDVKAGGRTEGNLP